MIKTSRNKFLALTFTFLAICLGSISVSGAAAESEPLEVQAGTILQNRCMVCHGCYDAPCQLKLEAHIGLERGASKDLVYDGTRLLQAQLSRLFDDAISVAHWREKGFYPVLDDASPDEGLMYRMLMLKQQHPLPVNGPLPEGFDLSPDRDQQCPKQDEFDDFAADYPLWGMPYALPGLNADEHHIMTSWLRAGATTPPPAPLSQAMKDDVDQWERFLNGDSPKQRLMARYIYEHLFLATLFLDTSDNPRWFRLVRSRTAPGKPIDLIATRRPYDDPGVDRVYYRLQRMLITPLDKNHLAYRFDRERRDWYQQLFLDADYQVTKLPGYDGDDGSNPFKSFEAIPPRTRYHFLLRQAQFTIGNFIKGPVCRGQIALNVIADRFWVMFIDPDVNDPELEGDFLARESDNLSLPQSETGSVIDLVTWHHYSSSYERFQKARLKFLTEQLKRPDIAATMSAIWDGDGNNPNAALTIFRHFDTASVVKGFVGTTPKTAWIINYSLLERIHYLLVAGFDVYGAVAHQLETRLYMDFLRMEGELNFLLFLPPEARIRLREYWYRDAPDFAKDNVLANSALVKERPSDLTFKTDDPKKEFLGWAQQRIYGADAAGYDYHHSSNNKALVAAFDKLVASAGTHNSYLPQVSFVSVLSDDTDSTYTILRDSGYSNIALPFLEDERRRKNEDKLTVVRGYIGAYPNLFFQVNEKQIPLFVEDILALDSADDWKQFYDRYAVRRTAPWFWSLSDNFHQDYMAEDPIYHGLFDFNRYDGNP